MLHALAVLGKNLRLKTRYYDRFFLWFAPVTPGRFQNSTYDQTKTTSFHKLLNILPVIWRSDSALVLWLGDAQFESWPENWLSSLSSPQPSSDPLVKRQGIPWLGHKHFLANHFQLTCTCHPSTDATQSKHYSTVWYTNDSPSYWQCYQIIHVPICT
jgi:hypothetical protein